MKYRLLPFVVAFLCSSVMSKGQDRAYAAFATYLSGENMDYESAQADAKRAVIARTASEKSYMEFLTEPVPLDYKGDMIRFAAVAGMDVIDVEKSFKISINGEEWLEIDAPRTGADHNFITEGKYGSRFTFKTKKVDKYKDLQGYMFLDLPTNRLAPGKAVKIKIAGVADGSGTWMMVYNYQVKNGVKVEQEPAITRGENGNKGELRFNFYQYGDPVDLKVKAGKERFKLTAELGMTSHWISIPEIKETTHFPVKVTRGKEVVYEEVLELQPVEAKTIYLMHHSHSDIGYTHVQKEVEELQWKYLEEAVALGEKSESLPEEAHFVWNTEVMWALDTYLANHSKEKQELILEGIRKGYIEANALWANQLTSLSRPEELLQQFESAQRISKMTGVPITTAMITDVPGYTWSLIEAMHLNGVKYFSIGTNTFHRIGDIIERWGDRPFYWQSPSGQGKVLCWIHEKGYSHFHTGLGFEKLENKLTPEIVFDYLKELEVRPYPYDIVTLRYNIGSDNGPVDPNLPEIVAAWNEKYVSPKLVISSVSDAFEAFEQKYGAELPVLKGDLTPYWEDGAASSARETALNRNYADRLQQMEVLASVTDLDSYNSEDTRKAWQHILFYNEHTWGSWNSISDPNNPFTLSQWATKKANVEKAGVTIKEMENRMLADLNTDVQNIEIFNGLSWKRGGFIKLTADTKLAGNALLDKNGQDYPIQTLSDGSHLVWIPEIDGFSSEQFQLNKVSYKKAPENFKVEDYSIESKHVYLEVDPITGGITHLIDKSTGRELVDPNSEFAFNQLVYVKGRDPKNRHVARTISVEKGEYGALMASLLVRGQLEGVEEFVFEIRLNSQDATVEFVDSFNKVRCFDPEGVHIAFPFAMDNAVVNMENTIGDYELGREQIPASCNNYYTIQQYVNLADKNGNINFVSHNAPLVEYGDITADPISYGFFSEPKREAAVFSYVMNNYWETNYKASQAGWHTFKYSVNTKAGAYLPAKSKQLGEEIVKPLLVKSINTDKRIAPWIKIENQRIVASTLKKEGEELIIRLQNLSDEDVNTTIKWPVSIDQDKLPDSMLFAPLEVKTVIMPRK